MAYGLAPVRQPQHFADGLTLMLGDDPGSGPFEVDTAGKLSDLGLPDSAWP